MKQLTFAEINDLENGQQIPAMQGTVKKVFDQKTGVGDYGPWHLQNLILLDDHANELQITWACADSWDTQDEGKHLLFESGHDKKDQLVGIKREIRTKNGKRYESVKVDDRAKVKITAPGGGENNATLRPGTPFPQNREPEVIPYSEALNEPVQTTRPKPSMLDERQRAIIRQHSQSMAIEVLKLKQMLGEITVEDLTPSKLTSLANYFDADVLEATK